jgi:hypothetical protein
MDELRRRLHFGQIGLFLAQESHRTTIMLEYGPYGTYLEVLMSVRHVSQVSVSYLKEQ